MEQNIESQNWNIFNNYFLSSDIFRLKKFLVKHNLFQKVVNVPGNIVELGVFKGVGFFSLNLVNIRFYTRRNYSVFFSRRTLPSLSYYLNV
mgnify:CR=1 FL=1